MQPDTRRRPAGNRAAASEAGAGDRLSGHSVDLAADSGEQPAPMSTARPRRLDWPAILDAARNVVDSYADTSVTLRQLLFTEAVEPLWDVSAHEQVVEAEASERLELETLADGWSS